MAIYPELFRVNEIGPGTILSDWLELKPMLSVAENHSQSIVSAVHSPSGLMGASMKKLFVAGVSLVALKAGGSAVAADRPLKAPPPVPPVYSWSGCYGGGFVGYGWANSQHATQKDAHGLDGRCGLRICARVWLVVEERAPLHRLWLDQVLRSGGYLFTRLSGLPASTRGQSEELYFPHRFELEVRLGQGAGRHHGQVLIALRDSSRAVLEEPRGPASGLFYFDSRLILSFGHIAAYPRGEQSDQVAR
jgi:hypothetical protein